MKNNRDYLRCFRNRDYFVGNRQKEWFLMILDSLGSQTEKKREKFFLSLLHIFWLNSQSTICNSLRTSKHSVCTSSAVGGWSSFVDMSQDNKANPNAYLQPDGSVAPEDRVKFLLAVEEKSKETLVNISTADILREKVRQCYRKEGMWGWSLGVRLGVGWGWEGVFILQCQSLRSIDNDHFCEFLLIVDMNRCESLWELQGIHRGLFEILGHSRIWN